ncbi:energy-coupling factor transporter transmembrane protein EcfT [Lysinibacter sp. HNR]|uniref:energy-coupling factor transporter transmembrane component T family protein n=1 Tax=Lysinibacter sp. HNR TaxID=3031408 RepID=UPI00243575C0|nr:energy-coupling factor transporter transmembrane protein EcfT [Lysinibacter sp. HNR]WGD36878.1 energy-coupling factor transporter transmembrane protein EcfT [Lysinibacter sp. HNR]
MLTLYRPGDGWLHRMPAGPKLVFLLLAVLGVSALPVSWGATLAASLAGIVAYAVAGLRDGFLGMCELVRQVWTVRWIILATLISQLVFLGPEPAIANTARVTVAIVLAGLLVLTTRVSTLLNTVERGLIPLRVLRIDPQRAALLLTVALGCIPVLVGLAGEVRDAQRARGARGGLRVFVVPYVVLVLKHADELGDALAARGLR